MQVKLFDRNNIESLVWPQTEEAAQAKDLLIPMLLDGVDHYIENVKTKLYLLQINEKLIPITVNEREYENSYLTSNYFPVKYAEEILSSKYPRLFLIQRPFIRAAGSFLKGLKINKAVIINNWLLTTNIYPELSKEELKAATSFISSSFPDYVIIFRSLNDRQCISLRLQLKSLQYRVLASRFVYFYDPEQKPYFSSKVHYHHRRDRKLIETEGYEIFRNEEMQENEIERLLELYKSIYLLKHTKYSPKYSEKYLRVAIEKGFFKIVGLKKEGQIYGVMGYTIRNGTMIIPFFGYDAEKDSSNHLYRMMTQLAIDEAEKENVVLNDGSGGEAPKKYRGMKPFQEYVALYDRHLPFHRRLFWGLAEKVMKKVVPTDEIQS